MIYLLYIISYIFLLYIIYISYFRYTHRFWSKQPVFHYHNLYYWFSPNKIIQNKFTATNYYDPINIECIPYLNITPYKKQQIYELIQHNYLKDSINDYNPDMNDIYSYLECHIEPSYIAYFKKNQYLFNISKKKFIPKENIQTCLTGRPLYVSLQKKKFHTYYVDFLCTDKKERKKGITPKLIYTFAYEMKKKNYTDTFLFKREGENTAIVPFTTYSCYVFDTLYWMKEKNTKDIKQYSHIQTTLINNKNIHIIERNLYQDIENKFNYTILPSIIHIKHLIEQNQLYIFTIHKGDTIIGYYIFRDTHTSFKNDIVFELIGSLCNDKEKQAIFISNLYNIISILQEKRRVRYMIIENTNDNHIVLKLLKKRKQEINKYMNSYYFYNYACHPVKQNECFILN